MPVLLPAVFLVSLFIGCGSVELQSSASESPHLRLGGEIREPQPRAESPGHDGSIEHNENDQIGPDSRRITIAATGDLLLTRPVVKVWRSMGHHDGISKMLAGYQGVLRDDDIAVLNLETPLVNDVNPRVPGSPPLPPVLGAPSEAVWALATAGVDLVSVANNHAFDQGYSGLERTLRLLEGFEIQHVGAGPTRESAYSAEVVERGGVRVAFVSMTGLINQRSERRGTTRIFVAVLFDEERVLEAIRVARNQADLVVVCVHWSTDFVPRATAGQRRLARLMIGAGADLILGTGPHVLQEVERLPSDRGEAVVAYSLGNLLSAQALRYRAGDRINPLAEPANVRPEARDGVVLRVAFEVSAARPIRIASIEAVPLWNHNTYWEHLQEGAPFEIRVVPLSEAPEEIARERRARIAEALGDQVELR